MRKGIFLTARQRVFNRQLRGPAGRRARLPLALSAGVLVLGLAAGAALAQGQPQPAQQGGGPSEQERQLDARGQELEARRAELERGLQQTELRFQQMVLEQDQQRRQLQKELSDLRERLRDVNNQLADLPRQRLQAKYAAALQALEQARAKRQQAEEQAEAARLAEQDASVAADRLRQLLRQMPPVPPESVRGEPPREKRTEMRERGLPERQRSDRRREQGLAEGSSAPQEPLRTVEPRGRAAGEAGERQGYAGTPGDGPWQQLDSLRGEIRRTEEQVKVATAQMDATRETLTREIAAVRTDLQRMGQTLGRIEQERVDAQGTLRTGVEKLRGDLEQVQQLCRTQRALDIALAQAHRSTVGSAAYW